ncbi:MAG: hypothetical protein JNK74_24435 [Candidatus Hydrogenedentes bacterium]|nr:hypothetical protein [Candidatus Hydrogenedentota bacterium]
MRWGDDTEEAFPPRHPREPGRLRQDILDEIADHLECAAEREAECGGENDTEDAAWGRVLERFGNPDAIARKLWWDEMRDTVMREWIQTGVVVVVAIAVVVFMTLVMRQMNTANQAVLEALKSNATAVNPLVTLKVKVTRGTEDGPPAEGVEIRLTGAAFGNERVHISRSTDATGVANFGPMQAGQFEAFATDPTSDLSFDGSKVVTLFAGSAPEVVKLVAPDVVPRDVSLDFSSPVVLGENRGLSGSVFAKWEINGAAWKGNTWFSVDASSTGDSDQETAQSASINMSGEITSVELQLGKPGNLHDNASLDSSKITPLQEGGGYRLEMPPAFVKQFDDWRVQDHAKSRGVELDDPLLNAVRNQFPKMVLDGASIISESISAAQRDASLSRWAEFSITYDESMLQISCEGQKDRAGSGKSIVSLFSPPNSLNIGTNSRLILAISRLDFFPMEMENELQIWPVFNDVASVLSTVDDSNVAVATPELGSEPAAVCSNTVLTKLASLDSWLLFDVTRGAAQDGAGAVPQAYLARWANSDSKHASFLAAIGTKNSKSMERRPMWLVLTPMGAEEVAAAK